VGVDTILHYTCRDRNLLGIQSEPARRVRAGVANILAITGDRRGSGTIPTRRVYDVDSID